MSWPIGLAQRWPFWTPCSITPQAQLIREQILGQLVTEKVRGLGAQPVNIKGEQFVYPLEPRDVEAAAFIRECKEKEMGIITASGQPAVWLDTPLIDMIRRPWHD